MLGERKWGCDLATGLQGSAMDGVWLGAHGLLAPPHPESTPAAARAVLILFLFYYSLWCESTREMMYEGCIYTDTKWLFPTQQTLSRHQGCIYNSSFHFLVLYWRITEMFCSVSLALHHKDFISSSDQSSGLDQGKALWAFCSPNSPFGWLLRGPVPHAWCRAAPANHLRDLRRAGEEEH